MLRLYPTRKCKPNLQMRALMLFLLAAAACSVSVPTHADQPRLYRDFDFGMPKSELLKLPNIYDCSGEFGEEGWLCLPEGADTFADASVEIAFTLIDDSLFSLTLVTGFSQQRYLDFIAALSARHELISMYRRLPFAGGRGTERVFDLFAEVRKAGGNQAGFRKNLADFEGQALQDGNITYSFVDRSWLESVAGPDTRNVVDLISKMGKEVRLVELSVTGSEGEFAGESFLTVRFTIPKMLETVITSKAQQDDDF